MFIIIKIIAGKNRGNILKTKEGITTRPTLNRIRENLFNIIRDKVPGANILDLFAGSGAIGIEALSRSAKSVTFIEIDKEAFNILKANINKTNNLENSKTINKDFRGFLRNCKDKFDLIYIDPPYHIKAYEEAIGLIEDKQLLNESGIIIIEAKKDTKLPLETKDFKCYRDVIYGNTIIKFYNKKQED
ncbi:MAG: 16S rRNA (guanine(966)-N(2))-methyltransferase RsmD [Firmicutes bacterium]|nr:16S rRNA (guanine(966)-N(2))-methyltransferase RsmD [Bacillota bacterium]